MKIRTFTPKLAIVGAMVAGAIAAPAAAEISAIARLRVTLGPQAQIDLDAGGLQVRKVQAQHGRTTLSAQRVTIHPTSDGIAVHVQAPVLGTAPASASAARTADAGPPPTRPKTRRGPSVPDTRGIAVTVAVDGTLDWHTPDADAVFVDPRVVLDGRGHATVLTDAVVSLAGGAMQVATEGAAYLTSTATGWQGQARLVIDGGAAVHAVVDLGKQITLTLTEPSGGRLVLTQRDQAIAIEVSALPVRALGNAPLREAERFGVLATDVVVSGQALLSRRPDGVDILMEQLRLTGVTLDHRALALGRVQLSPVTVRGALASSSPSGPRDAAVIRGSVVVAHDTAQLQVAGRVAPERVELDVTVPPMPCQALIDAVPEGMAPQIRGARLSGTIEGHLRLAVDRIALAQAHGVLDRDHPPGALDFAFPFLERCTVLADPPSIDLEGLAGPYRHRFVAASGAARTRVMAPGAPGYVALEDARLLADALVTLEDYRFWDHDGFDRDQMRFAFWHNLVVGRVSRGASTLSQQTARNLWLGVDRSLSRKVQEALLTARLEARVDKARIAELYINVIELGPDVHGVADAAEFYFGRRVGALSPLQAVHLAALAPAPRRYAADFATGQPPEAWMKRLREHLRRMRRAGLLSQSELSAALRSELALLDRTVDAG